MWFGGAVLYSWVGILVKVKVELVSDVATGLGSSLAKWNIYAKVNKLLMTHSYRFHFIYKGQRFYV